MLETQHAAACFSPVFMYGAVVSSKLQPFAPHTSFMLLHAGAPAIRGMCSVVRVVGWRGFAKHALRACLMKPLARDKHIQPKCARLGPLVCGKQHF
jgi:hypothetical protein